MTVTRRQVLTQRDLKRFKNSPSYHSYARFIRDLSSSIRSLPLSSPIITQSYNASPSSLQITQLFQTINDILINTPPQLENTQNRYADPTFRLFYDRVNAHISTCTDGIFQGEHAQELREYFIASFGSRQRLDYGSGHETHFGVFLYACHALGYLTTESFPGVALRVFPTYMSMMRDLQRTYLLEPAGSHGVWGLDDYHHLPFLFGASQLINHPYIKPKSIHSHDILTQFSPEYLYLDQILHTNLTKPTVTLRWHSPLLNDISNSRSWEKVEKGMALMYEETVLSKLPIIQHQRFGRVFVFPEYAVGELTEKEWEEREMLEKMEGHQHVYAMGQEYPTCCGMRLPASNGMTGYGGRVAEQGDLRTLRQPSRLPVD